MCIAGARSSPQPALFSPARSSLPLLCGRHTHRAVAPAGPHAAAASEAVQRHQPGGAHSRRCAGQPFLPADGGSSAAAVPPARHHFGRQVRAAAGEGRVCCSGGPASCLVRVPAPARSARQQRLGPHAAASCCSGGRYPAQLPLPPDHPCRRPGPKRRDLGLAADIEVFDWRNTDGGSLSVVPRAVAAVPQLAGLDGSRWAGGLLCGCRVVALLRPLGLRAQHPFGGTALQPARQPARRTHCLRSPPPRSFPAPHPCSLAQTAVPAAAGRIQLLRRAAQRILL